MGNGRSSMGNRKHGRSGTPGKSPRLRHRMELEAQREEGLRRRSSATHGSVLDLMRGRARE